MGSNKKKNHFSDKKLQSQNLNFNSLWDKPKKITRSIVTIHHVRRCVSFQKDSGCIELNDQLSEFFGFVSAEEAKKNFEIHFVAYSKIPTLDVNVYFSAIMIWYIRYVLIDFRSEWDDKYKETSTWISKQIMDDQIEKELLEAARIFVIKRFEVDEETLQEDDYFLTFKFERSKSLTIEDFIAADQVKSEEKKQEKQEKQEKEKSSWNLGIWDSVTGTIKSASTGELKEKHEKAEKYLSTQLGSEKEMKQLLEATDKIVVEQTTKKIVKEKANQAIVEKAQESVTEEEAVKVVETQNDDGSFEISKQITEKLDINTTKDILSSINITDNRVKTLDTKVWNTFLTLAYTNKVLGKHGSKLKVQNEKARDWLHKQIKDEKLEKEILESCEKVVVDKVSKKTIKQKSEEKKQEKQEKQEKAKSSWNLSIWDSVTGTIKSATTGVSSIYDYFTRDETEEEKSKRLVIEKQQAAIVAIQTSTTIEKTQTIISTQKTNGSFELSDIIRKKLDATSTDTLISSIKSQTENESIKQVSTSAYSTALTICYLQIAASHHKTHWNTYYERARKYLKEQIKNEKLEEELLAVCSKYVATKATEKVEKKQTRKTITVIQSSTTLEKTQTIVSSQKKDGSFSLSSVISKKLGVESDKLVSSVNSTLEVSEKLKKVTDESIYSTAVSLNYLKIAANKYEGEWRTKYEEAKKYLSKRINDVELEEELLNVTNQFVIKKATEKVVHKEKQAALVHLQVKTTPQTAMVVCKTQKQDGSFDISETITKNVNVTTETVTSSIQPYIVNEKLKKVDSKIFSTAIAIW